MTTVTMKLSDLGEGVSEAELIEWNVSVGDAVREDDILATVMTDKAAVEIPAAADGTVAWLAGAPGDFIPVGSDLVRLEVGDPAGAPKDTDTAQAPQAAEVGAEETRAPEVDIPPPTAPPAQRQAPTQAPIRPLASPSVRSHAAELGVNLSSVTGSGPDGRILHKDIKAPRPARIEGDATGGREIKLTGLRRRIAEKMAVSKSRIPHYAIVEEIDVTALEELRVTLNAKYAEQRGKLTVLSFVILAAARAIGDHPGVNGHFDDETGTLRLSKAIHMGVAIQTPAGLTAPVIRNAESRSLWNIAAEIARLADLARRGRASREDLTGSTITVTSLGPLGGIVTTPIINHPEVAIIGLNRIDTRPVWEGGAFRPRRMMNLSCSFDHRVIDGWDGAMFVQAMKELLEAPALLFVDEG